MDKAEKKKTGGKTFGQSQKTLRIEQILMERTDEDHKLTAEQIGQILEDEYKGLTAERKAIYRYIDALEDADIDVCHDSEGYFIASRTFELPELKLLVDAVQSSRFITEKKSSELIKKLGTLASSHQAKSLRRQVYASGRIKSMNESIYRSIDGIHSALIENKRITFLYFDWNEKKERIYRHGGVEYVADPLLLCWDDEKYYLIARDLREDKIKHYRVDKMEKIRVTDDIAASPKLTSDEIEGYTSRHFGMYGGDEVKAVLRCRNELAGVIIDRFGKDVPIRPTSDGYFTATVSVAESVHFFTWILNFGGGVSIASPDGLKTRFKSFVADANKWVNE